MRGNSLKRTANIKSNAPVLAIKRFNRIEHAPIGESRAAGISDANRSRRRMAGAARK
jgi:hypothetical protein